jgi:hypothetical protein
VTGSDATASRAAGSGAASTAAVDAPDGVAGLKISSIRFLATEMTKSIGDSPSLIAALISASAASNRLPLSNAWLTA